MKPNPIPFALRYRRAWLCWAANGLRYLRPNGVAELTRGICNSRRFDPAVALLPRSALLRYFRSLTCCAQLAVLLLPSRKGSTVGTRAGARNKS